MKKVCGWVWAGKKVPPGGSQSESKVAGQGWLAILPWHPWPAPWTTAAPMMTGASATWPPPPPGLSIPENFETRNLESRLSVPPSAKPVGGMSLLRPGRCPGAVLLLPLPLTPTAPLGHPAEVQATPLLKVFPTPPCPPPLRGWLTGFFFSFFGVIDWFLAPCPHMGVVAFANVVKWPPSAEGARNFFLGY